MDLKDKFEAAIAASKTLSKKPDQETLLELYSWYKQGNEGDAPEKGDYGMFDFVAKAKHEAWSKKQGTSREEAMIAYINLVEKLKTMV